MKGVLDSFYKDFGKLVHLHRKRCQGMTQKKLGLLVGLSRTSITNIEKGRQHVSVHQLCAIADALKITPDAFLPSVRDSGGKSWLAEKLPPGIDPKISEWADKLVGNKTRMEPL